MRLGRRGFVQYDMWLAGAGLLMLLAIVVPRFVPGARDHALRRALHDDVIGFAAVEDVVRDSTGHYAQSVTVQLARGDSVVLFSTGATGWTVAVTNRAIRAAPTTCGTFEGIPPSPPPAEVRIPGVVSCW